MTNQRFEGRAIVVGAGMAGLLAARVLHDWYEEVTIIDRDRLPQGCRPRGGVAQGAHAHALLARGQQLLEMRLPGLTSEMAADGATIGDVLGDVRMSLSGHRLCSAPTGLTAVSASRAFLEWHVRRRVQQLPRLSIRDGADVVGLTTTEDRRSITGVQLLNRRDGSAAELLTGQAVIDASGRRSRLPAWLADLDLEPPRDTNVEVGLAYASCRIRLDRAALGGDIAIIEGMTPACPRGGVVAALEGGTGIVTLAGIGPERPPTDPDGFVEFARSLGHADIYDVVSRAEPLDKPVPFRFPASTRRHLERHPRLPAGLACLGDAFCSLNPVYGQGMTLAALSAEALDRHLHRHRRIVPISLHRDVAAVVRPAWQMVTGADLALPTVPGKPNPAQRLLGNYIQRLHASAALEPSVAVAFARVAGLIDGPRALLRPHVVRRVLTLRRSPA